VEDLRFPSASGSFNPQSIAKPYRLFQIVDTPESSETVLNTALVGTPQQPNRTVVGQHTYLRTISGPFQGRTNPHTSELADRKEFA
jgi:hypothetical protein